MKKFGDYVCNHKTLILIITMILFALSLIGIKITKTNYDILVYLPKDIETVKGQDILTEDFNMGSFSIITINNMSSNDILNLEDKIRDVDGVNKVASLYDAIGTDVPKEYLPSDIVSKISTDNDDVLLVTFNGSTSSDSTIKAVNDIRNITNDKEFVKVEIISRYMDYVIDLNTGNTIYGDDTRRIEKRNILMFEKKIDAKDTDIIRKCPGCGASMSVNTSGKCEYCGTIFNQEDYDYVLVELNVS